MILNGWLFLCSTKRLFSLGRAGSDIAVGGSCCEVVTVPLPQKDVAEERVFAEGVENAIPNEDTLHAHYMLHAPHIWDM